MRDRSIGWAVVVGLCAWAAPAGAGDLVTTVCVDADAYVEAGTWGGAHETNNYGAGQELKIGNGDWNRKFYLHFDLGGLPYPALAITEARLKVAWKNTEYNGGQVKIFAIMDEEKDWDLAMLPETGSGGITYTTAPQCGAAGNWDFLEEGTTTTATTRFLATSPYYDTGTPSPIDPPVTGVVKWVLGRDDDYSTFADTDDELTICVRQDSDWNYVNYYSREYTTGTVSDCPRLEITRYAHPGDATCDNTVDVLDLARLANNFNKTPAEWTDADFNGDGVVDVLDLAAIANNFGWSGGAGADPAAVPTPSTFPLLAAVVPWALKRRDRRRAR